MMIALNCTKAVRMFYGLFALFPIRKKTNASDTISNSHRQTQKKILKINYKKASFNHVKNVQSGSSHSWAYFLYHHVPTVPLSNHLLVFWYFIRSTHEVLYCIKAVFIIVQRTYCHIPVAHTRTHTGSIRTPRFFPLYFFHVLIFANVSSSGGRKTTFSTVLVLTIRCSEWYSYVVLQFTTLLWCGETKTELAKKNMKLDMLLTQERTHDYKDGVTNFCKRLNKIISALLYCVPIRAYRWCSLVPNFH